MFNCAAEVIYNFVSTLPPALFEAAADVPSPGYSLTASQLCRPVMDQCHGDDLYSGLERTGWKTANSAIPAEPRKCQKMKRQQLLKVVYQNLIVLLRLTLL